MDYAEKVIADENPLVPFEQTYRMHRQLRIAGIEISGVRQVPQRVTRTIRYRVDHGNGYHTQHTWHPGNAVPSIVEIKEMV